MLVNYVGLPVTGSQTVRFPCWSYNFNL